MAHNSAACAEHVSNETLSAWRDELLPSAEMQRVRAHIAECAACQQQLQHFEGVARALRSQREIEPGERIIEGVRLRIAQPARRGWGRREFQGQYAQRRQRGRIWGDLRVLLPVAAVLLLFVYVLGTGPRLPFTQQGKATKTATPGKPNVSGVLTVNDASIAGQLSFAYVQNNDVWVSRFGSRPKQLTHLGLAGQQLQWELVWSADQTRLLASASDSSTGSHERNWIITVPGGVVTPQPVLFLGCSDLPRCYWMDDRYVLYNDLSQASPHSYHYHIYDTLTQRVLATALDSQAETEVEVRGSAVYFSPYDWSNSDPLRPGTIQRFDLTSNRITTAYTTPGPLVTQGIDNGKWDLSADAQGLIVAFAAGVAAGCPTGACDIYLLHAQNAPVTPLFLHHHRAFPGQDVVLSPDGRFAAELIGGSETSNGILALQLAQQTLPTGGELTNTLPTASQGNDRILGWASGSAGILIQRTFYDADLNPTATSIYYAPTGTGAAAELVETVHVASTVAFAPPAA